MAERPPIRIMTRLLAELQTSIISHGLPLTDGDIDRFAILSLIVRQTSTDRHATRQQHRIPVMSLASSLSKPYETVRRHVSALAASGLCDRSSRGVSETADPRGKEALEGALRHSHDGVVRFIYDLRSLDVPLPMSRFGVTYRAESGMAAAVDIMLSVLDGNRAAHDAWLQLVLFSAILSVNVHQFARDPNIAKKLRDERTLTPVELNVPATIAQVARRFGMPESTVRRHVTLMEKDGRLVRRPSGWVVSEDWLNHPNCVTVSRESFASMKRIFERLAAAGFPFHDPASAYLSGRPADVTPDNGFNPANRRPL